MNKVQSMGCYQCMSGGTFPRDEACEVGRRSATYNNICIPREQPPGANARVYCVKAIGSEGSDDRLGPVVIRTCSYNYRTECKDGISVDGRIIRGCIHACADADFCNTGVSQKTSMAVLSIALALLVFRFCFCK